MEKNDNFIKKIFKSVKNLFINLFGLGRHKNKMSDELLDISNQDAEQPSDLKEEEIISPTRQILRKFFKNRIALTGLIMFAIIVLFVVIGNYMIDFDRGYLESSQRYLPPSIGYTKVPRKLKKSGVKIVLDENGLEIPLMGIGNSFTVAISNDNNIYVWGANTNDIKDIPKEVKDRVADIVQLSVGTRHIIALARSGDEVDLFAWGSNTFQISTIPIYNENIDSTFAQHKKTIEAYFRPEARTMYPNDVVSTIEEDPIYKIYAGDNFTSVLTKAGYVYSWGVTNTLKISEPYNSFRAMNRNFQYVNDTLQWKFNAQPLSEYQDFLSRADIIDRYALPEQQFDGDKLVDTLIRVSGTRLQYQAYEYDEEEDKYNTAWVNIAETNDFSAELEDRTIVDMHILYEHILYELDDNSFILVGFLGPVETNLPPELQMSEQERGYRISKVVGTFRNAFYLTEDGNVFGWGERMSENNINEIPVEVQNSKIKDISSAANHMLAVDESGKVYIWGYQNRLNQLDMPDNLSKSRMTVSNFFNSYSIGEDGSIVGWGNNGYIFGTNENGANNLHRIIAGGAKTMTLALVAVVVSLIIGLTVGLVAGFYGKWLDNLLMRFGEIINAFPFLPLAMTLAAIVQEQDMSDTSRVYLIMVVLGLLSWPGLARLVRGQILAEREKDYIMAAKALGIKERNIILKHILPNVINVVIVSTTLSYASALLTESGLSFLGFGVKPPEPTWGNMLTGAQDISILRNYWWVWIIPAFFIIMTALSVNLVGDGLRDAMDPKSNER